MRKIKLINPLIIIILVMMSLPENISATTYYPAVEYGKTGTVSAKALNNGKLRIYWYNFKWGLQDGKGPQAFSLGQGIDNDGGSTSNILNGNNQIYGKITGKHRVINSSYHFAYQKSEYNGDISTSKLTEFGVWGNGGCCYQKIEHYHYVKIDVPASIICDGSPEKWNYIAMGATDWVITYKALGCNPTCGCKTYAQKSDASCGCQTYNTCDDTSNCLEHDTETSDDVRIYSLSGTNVSTGETINATCNGSTCTF